MTTNLEFLKPTPLDFAHADQCARKPSPKAFGIGPQKAIHQSWQVGDVRNVINLRVFWCWQFSVSFKL